MTGLTETDTTRILRFEVPVNDEWNLIRVPKNGVLHVGCRTARAVEFWMRESDRGVEVRAYRVYRTGQPIPPGAGYEGTAVAPGGTLVWHLLSTVAEVAA